MSDTYVLPNKQLAAAMLSPVRTLVTFFFVLTVPLLIFWCVCLFLYFGSWHQSIQPLAELFQASLGALSPGEPLARFAGVADYTTSWLHQVLFVSTGFQSMAAPVAPSNGFERATAQVTGLVAPSFHVVIASTQVFAVRLAILIGMLPLIALAYFLAHTDGIAERAIRRACAGRESASLYHRAKYLQYGLVGILLIVTLCLPMHVDPSRTMIVFVLLLASLSRVQWTYYKKYF